MPSVCCPNCQHTLDLKGVHSGRFTPKCPACQQRFVLIIPPGPDAVPVVQAMPGAGATAVGTAAGATVPPPGATVQATAAPPGYASPGHTSPAQTIAPPSQTMATAPPILRGGAAAATAPPASGANSGGHASGNGGGAGVGATLPPGATQTGAGTTYAGATRADVGLTGSRGDLPPRTIMGDDTPSGMHGPELTGSLGGYELMQKLGEGGMGAVYLARQVSLDRQVALKVLSPQLAADPQFVARFTREAYAAAQLSHHNVVQIHDIGFDRDTNFFSMEFVPGKTLEKIVHGDGKLDPEVAVGYVLQAARGLRFAHEHGLIHRDVKPDNLLLNEQGIVKVADLGLVKQAGKEDLTRPGGGMAKVHSAAAAGRTQFNISMGTPAYMPPEQARDAAHVDQRADVYSLGCTLYDLLTGRPPFEGKTAVEVITKHQTAPVVPPDRMAKHVSPELSATVMKMMAKRPEDRYQTMAEVVEALEAILGVESGKPFSPKEEHVHTLEAAVDQFNGSKWANLRKQLVIGFFGACATGAVVCAIPAVGQPLWAGGIVGFAVLTFLFYQLLIGVTRKTHLFTRVRQFAFGARVVDWLKFVGGFAVVVLLLVLFDLHWAWLAAAVAAAGVAAALHFTLDRFAEKDRTTPVGHVEAMLRTMRLRGLDETALRQFVCKYSGDRWEELYESLFGYEAKRAARRTWGRNERDRERRKFGAWRDWVIDWIDRRTVARRADRERTLLAKLEAKALAAKGLDPASASRKAKQAADRMVSRASEVKASADKRAMMTALPTRTSSGRTIMFEGAKSLASWADGFAEEDDRHAKKHAKDGDEERAHESYFKRRFGTPLDYLLGPHPRILFAVILLCLFGLWVKQNAGIKVTDAQLASRLDPTELAKQAQIKIAEVKRNYEGKDRQPLRLTMIPNGVADLVGTYNGGVAGALLLLSGFFTGKRMSAVVYAAAAFILIGATLPIPVVNGSPWIAAGIGIGAGLLGIMFFRRTSADS